MKRKLYPIIGVVQFISFLCPWLGFGRLWYNGLHLAMGVDGVDAALLYIVPATTLFTVGAGVCVKRPHDVLDWIAGGSSFLAFFAIAFYWTSWLATPYTPALLQPQFGFWVSIIAPIFGMLISASNNMNLWERDMPQQTDEARPEPKMS